MTDLIRTIIIMSLSGSALALLLFVLKPIVRNYLPKSAQYYLWLVVVIALLVPISQIIVLPDNQTAPLPVAPVVSENVTRFVITQGEQQARLQDISHLAITNNPAYLQERQTIESPLVNLTTLFMIIYPFGVLILGLYYLINYMIFARLYRRRNRPARDEALALLEQICSESVQARSTCTSIRSGKTPKLYRNSLAKSPMLLGIFRPAIILPDEDYSEEQLHAIFAHELIHLRRKDTIVKWLTLIATCLHWFNPIVWFVRREIDRNCELACDEAVIQSFDVNNANNKQSYGNVLLDVSANFTAPKAIAATMMCEEKKNLKERLDSIVKSKKHTRVAIALSLVLIVSAVCLVLVLGSGSDNGNNNLSSGTSGLANDGTSGLSSVLDNGYVFECHRFGIKLILPAEFEGRYSFIETTQVAEPADTRKPDTLTFFYLDEVYLHHFVTEALLTDYNPVQFLDSLNVSLFSIYRFPKITARNIEDYGVLLFETDEFYFVFVEPIPLDRFPNVDLDDPATIAYLELAIRNDEVHNRLRAYPFPTPTVRFWQHPKYYAHYLYEPTIYSHLNSELGILLVLPIEFRGNYRVSAGEVTFTLDDPQGNAAAPVTIRFVYSKAEPHIHRGRELFTIHRFNKGINLNFEAWGVLLLETDEHYFVFAEPRSIDANTNFDFDCPVTQEYLQLVIRNHEVHERLIAQPSHLAFAYDSHLETPPLGDGYSPLQGTGQLIHPLPADSFRLTMGFGAAWGRMHNGVDLAAPRGTHVGAADGGTVTFSGYRGAMGNLITIYHGGGIETLYAHLNERHVSEGDQVFQGQHIGDVGSTGRVTGPHLHFEVHVNGVPRNPLDFLQ